MKFAAGSAGGSEMTEPQKKPLMRCIGEFFGHIIKAVRKDVPDEKKVIESSQTEERRGEVILRETRVREVEFRSDE